MACLNGGDVAADDDGDVGGADLLFADQLDGAGFEHFVGGMEGGDEALGFDEAKCTGICHGLFSLDE